MEQILIEAGIPESCCPADCFGGRIHMCQSGAVSQLCCLTQYFWGQTAQRFKIAQSLLGKRQRNIKRCVARCLHQGKSQFEKCFVHIAAFAAHPEVIYTEPAQSREDSLICAAVQNA